MDEHNRRMEEQRKLYHLPDTECREFSRQFFMPNMSVEQFRQQVAAGKKDFVDICLEARADLNGIDLAEANLTGARLLGANLSEANLSGANLSYAHLDFANLSCADLRGANLTHISIGGANLSRANLKGAKWDFSMAHGTLYHNTICPDGTLLVGPDSFEG